MKAVKWLFVFLLPLFFFVIIIGVIGASEKRNKEGSGVCAYTSAITENEKLEKQRFKVKNRIVNEELVNVVLGIYAVNEYKDLDKIINTIDEHYVYVTEKNKNISEISYIQAYLWGKNYIDYLLNKNENSSISFNKEYETYMGFGLLELKDYNYYMKVLSIINSNCSTSVDGLPLKKPYTITGWFPNYNKDGSGDKHYGIDFGVEMGTDIFTVSDGEVIASNGDCPSNDGYLGNVCGVKSGYQGSGNFVFVKSKVDGVDYYIIYCHMKDISVQKDESVYKGQKIGTSGNSGNSSGAHLHFEIHKNSKNLGSDDGIVNPCEFVEGLCE